MGAKVTDHVEIWLEPSCDKCDIERTWCQSNVYDPCTECGRQPTCYVALAEVTALLDQVKGASY